MRLITIRCGTCGRVCTDLPFDYCGMDLCEDCYDKRTAQEEQTHTKRMELKI